MKRDYPEPLQAGSLFNPAGWFLPATTLSLLSMAAVLLVTLGLQSTAGLRDSFQLPLPGFLILWMASATAGWVAWRCRFRPGLLLPRYWALGLTALSASLGLWSFVSPSPGLSAAGAGALAASLVLVGRLLRVRPDDKHPERLPLLILGLLALYVLLVLWIASPQQAFGLLQEPNSWQEAAQSGSTPSRGQRLQQYR